MMMASRYLRNFSSSVLRCSRVISTHLTPLFVSFFVCLPVAPEKYHYKQTYCSKIETEYQIYHCLAAGPQPLVHGRVLSTSSITASCEVWTLWALHCLYNNKYEMFGKYAYTMPCCVYAFAGCVWNLSLTLVSWFLGWLLWDGPLDAILILLC